MKYVAKTILVLLMVTMMIAITACSENESDSSLDDSMIEEAYTEPAVVYKDIFSQSGTHIWYFIRYPQPEDGASFDFGRSAELMGLYVFQDGKVTIYDDPELGLLDENGDNITLDMLSKMSDEEVIKNVKQWHRNGYDKFISKYETGDAIGSIKEGTTYIEPQACNIEYFVTLDETGNSTASEWMKVDNYQMFDIVGNGMYVVDDVYGYVKTEYVLGLNLDADIIEGEVYESTYRGVLWRAGMGVEWDEGFVTRDDFDYIELNSPEDDGVSIYEEEEE